MAKILVVDDVPEIERLYSLVLAKKGHAVTVASSVMQALMTVEKQEFDYIFLDMKMPDEGGLDFLRKAHMKTKHPGTKVIALSNSESEKMIAEAKALGAVDYLVKVDFSPYGLARLMESGEI